MSKITDEKISIIIQMFKNGQTFSAESHFDGRSLWRYDKDTDSIVLEFESVHGGPVLGHPDCITERYECSDSKKLKEEITNFTERWVWQKALALAEKK